jgi:hypothetical protein
MVIKTMQFIHSKLVQPNFIQTLSGTNGFTWCSGVFPYTVPSGFWLGITDMQLGSKFTDGGAGARASMLVLNNVVSVPDNAGPMHFRVPLVIPSGTVLTADIINNDVEQQWMNSVITGLLVEQVAGQTWQDAFSFLFQPSGSVTIPPIQIPPVSVNIPSLTGTINLSAA